MSDTIICYYEEVLYVCLNCGWDEFHGTIAQDRSVVPFYSVPVYICEQCEAININEDYQYIYGKGDNYETR